MGRSRVAHLPGRVEATDAEILEAYKKMPFLQHIRSKYKVGLARLRKITREYDAQKGISDYYGKNTSLDDREIQGNETPLWCPVGKRQQEQRGKANE